MNAAAAGPTTAPVPTHAAQTPTARKYAEVERQVVLCKREFRQAEEASAANRTVLEQERAVMGRRVIFLAQHRADFASVWERLAASNRVIIEAEGAMSGAAGLYDQAHHALVSERDRAANHKHQIPHMRTVREAARATMQAEDEQCLNRHVTSCATRMRHGDSRTAALPS